MTMHQSPPRTDHSVRSDTRTVVAVAAGNIMEWYDFGLYAFMATYLAPNFFAGRSPISGVLNVLLVFGLAFLFRPLGGLLLGPLGDRKGRLFSLLLTFLGMTVATVAVGILPTQAAIGMAAPMLLVLARIVQGIAAGGESGLAITYLTEKAPAHRRGFYSSFVQASSIAGFLLATLVTWLTLTWVDPADLTSWGWRIPFLLALPFGLVGLYIRWKLEETPEFTAMARDAEIADKPARTALRRDWRVILRIAAISAFQNVGYYTAYTYFSGYLHRHGFDTGSVSRASTVTLVIAIVTVPLFGLLSDKVGRKPVLTGAALTALVITVPAFALMSGLGYAGIVVCQILLALTVAAFNSTTGAMYSELTHARTRAGSVTIGFNLGSLLFAAPTLYVMTLIETTFSTSWAPGIYMAVAALVSVVAVFTLPRDRLSRGAQR
jgi:MHS family proline/betaine transporter-like MFS transporter